MGERKKVLTGAEGLENRVRNAATSSSAGVKLAAFLSLQSDIPTLSQDDRPRRGAAREPVPRPPPCWKPGPHRPGLNPPAGSPDPGPQTFPSSPTPTITSPVPPPRDKSRTRHFRRRGQRACAGRRASGSSWQRRRAANGRERRAARVRVWRLRRRGLRSGGSAAREVQPTPRGASRSAPFPSSLPRALLPGSRPRRLARRRGHPGRWSRRWRRPRARARPLAPRPAQSPPSPPPSAGAGQLQRSRGAGGGAGAVRLARAECEARRAAARTDAPRAEGRRPLADAPPRAAPGARPLARPCARPAPSSAPAGP